MSVAVYLSIGMLYIINDKRTRSKGHLDVLVVFTTGRIGIYGLQEVKQEYIFGQ